jgi:hypothetical protein
MSAFAVFSKPVYCECKPEQRQPNCKRTVCLNCGFEFRKVWAICDAPAGGCGGGRRRRVLVPFNYLWCPACSSQMKLAKNQRGAP